MGYRSVMDVGFSFGFSVELLKLTLLLDHYPEFILTHTGTCISCQDEKESLLCNTGNPVNLTSPSVTGQIYLFLLLKVSSPHMDNSAFLPELQAQASTPSTSCTYSTSNLEAEHYSIAKEKRALAPTGAGFLQQRMCGC